MEKYYLNNWVHGCVADNNLVLLDTRKDAYYLIPKDEWQTLQSLIANYPFSSSHLSVSTDITSHQKANETVKKLLENDIITSDCEKGRPISPPQIKLPSNLFEQIDAETIPDIKWHHVLSVTCAGLRAHLELKYRPFNSIISSIKKSNKNFTQDLERIKTMSRIFDRLRPFLIRNRICLYDSLAFYYFCNFYGFRPQIVFGVTASPFAAHCWAQTDDLILNDFPAKIADYTPIMVI